MASEEGAGLSETGGTEPAAEEVARARRRMRVRTTHRSGRAGTGLGGRLFLLVLALGLVVLAFELAGKPLRLPNFLVAEVENRLNASMRDALPDTILSVGGIEVEVGGDWVPHLRLEDLRLNRRDGPVVLTLPETQLTLDPKPILSGQLRARSLRISGAEVIVRRDAAGRFDFQFGAGQGPRIDSLGALFAAIDRTFESPSLTGFRKLEADALSLTFDDAISGRVWSLGDGHFVFENRGNELASQLGLSLIGASGGMASADVTAVMEKGRGAARIAATIDGVAATDLAAQTPVLGFLGVLDAPISGRIRATLDKRGVQGMEGRLEIGQGAVRPSEAAAPLAFDRAALMLGYSPRDGRVTLKDVSVESRALRLKAQGQAYLVDATGKVLSGPLDGRRPASFLGQLSFDRVQVDPEGLFAAPIEFSQGALDLRLAFAPFALDIGQFALAEGDQRFLLKGRVAAQPDGRLQTALDLSVNRIDRDGLLALWPPRLATPTRNWVVDNLKSGSLTDIRGALRQQSGAEPKLELDYGFRDARFSFMTHMPPVEGAEGYAAIQDRVYTLALEKGHVTAPQGGPLDMAGSVMRVPDILAKPATGRFRIHARGSLTASLSILDQPPFHFLTKAGQPVDLGQGTAETLATVRVPLVGKVQPGDVDYLARATIRDFRSDKLIAGKTVTAASLAVLATPRGMTISGPGQVGQVPVRATFARDFAPGSGPPVVDGTVVLGPAAIQEFHIGLPDGAVTGEGTGRFRLVLPKGAPPQLTLNSDLRGLTLTLPEVSWKKPAAATGRLQAVVDLTSPPHLPRIALEAAGLSAEGDLSVTPEGGLDRLHLAKAKVGDWFSGSLDLKGRGTARAPAIDVLSGSFDLRRFPGSQASSGSGSGQGPLTARLDRMRVTESIALTGFQGRFDLAGGMTGTFQARVNGAEGTEVTGEVAPSAHGTSVHLTGQDAGAVARATGMYTSAYGGSLDMDLTPRSETGAYDGQVTIGSVRVRYGSVLADLLNAVSVVGLLQQLNGAGILFDQAEGQFILTPAAVLLKKGSAIGASMGISMSGIYRADQDALDMQGVVSPIYLLNGFGAMLTRKGEGLFGFNYRLTGASADPAVEVNPLSILTPGMFREIFRRRAPELPGITQ